jgi:hypothetical protein
MVILLSQLIYVKLDNFSIGVNMLVKQYIYTYIWYNLKIKRTV